MDVKKELLQELNFTFDMPVRFEKGQDGLKIRFDGKEVYVSCSSDKEYCRALLLIKAKGFSTPYELSEACAFDDFGFMIDCSRNAVLKEETVKKLLRLLALLGYNQLMLYTEDVYEVDGEPYFGYLRGKYSKQELKSLSAYASGLGIELVPCVQTLAHLNAITRWGEYSPTIDCGDILLVDNERTYELIENMFKSLRECYGTEKIHIGMDEAHMLGLGKHLDKFGYEQRIEIFNRHLIKVRDIAKKYGFKPMIWSDMFFRSVSGGQYKPFPRDVMEKIKAFVPSGVDLVCWDYYNVDDSHYKDFIDCHKLLTEDVIFANGLWSWQGFAPHIRYTLDSIRSSTRACMEKGVKRFFSTSWGDDGAECPIFALLPMLAAQAQLAYKDFDLQALADVFLALTGVDYDYFSSIERVNEVGDYPLARQNPSKYMLYNDPMLGVVDCLVVDGDKEKLKGFIKRMEEGRGGEYSYIFDSLKALAEAVYFKYDLGVRLREAYKEGDKAKLQEFRDSILPTLLTKVESFYRLFRARWYKDNKPFGFDVHDIRIGGLKQRISNTILTLDDYLTGKMEAVAELEETILNFHCNVDYDKSITLNKWVINSTCGIL